MLGKSPFKWRHLNGGNVDMIIAVDWDVKHQFKQAKTILLLILDFFLLNISILIIYMHFLDYFL